MESMPCPACGQPNRSEARYCWACGAAQVRACDQCHSLNRLSARFCLRCGARLGVTPVAPDLPASGAASAAPVSPAEPSPSPLRVLEAHTYPGFGRARERVAAEPVSRFRVSDTAFHIRLRLANLAPARQHSHRLFVQFFRPNGRLHNSRERVELVVAPQGHQEVETSIFGLRISGSEVVNHPGMWRATVYLDEEKLVEIPFEVVQ